MEEIYKARFIIYYVLIALSIIYPLDYLTHLNFSIVLDINIAPLIFLIFFKNQINKHQNPIKK